MIPYEDIEDYFKNVYRNKIQTGDFSERFVSEEIYDFDEYSDSYSFIVDVLDSEGDDDSAVYVMIEITKDELNEYLKDK